MLRYLEDFFSTLMPPSGSKAAHKEGLKSRYGSPSSSWRSSRLKHGRTLQLRPNPNDQHSVLCAVAHVQMKKNLRWYQACSPLRHVLANTKEMSKPR